MYWKKDLLVDFEWKIKWWDGNYKYEWDYWDWKKWIWKTPDHKYTEAWIYIVKLKVKDWDWNVWTSTVTIVVIEEDIEKNKGLWIKISANPLKTEVWKNIDFIWIVEWGSWIYIYEWFFDDGSKWSWKRPNHSYFEPWEYKVKVIVIDSNWKKGVAYVTIMVTKEDEIWKNLWVWIYATPLKWEEWMKVDFEWIVDWWKEWCGYTYVWNFWDWTKWLGETPDHIYDNAGTYVVEFTVTDCEWRTWSSQIIIVVDWWNNNWWKNNWLWVAIDANPLTIFVRDKINFEGLVEWGDWKYVYIWDFWDNKGWTSKNPVHRYIKEWTYTVVLNIVDWWWKTWRASVVINVKKVWDYKSEEMWLQINATPLHWEGWMEVDFEWIVYWWTWPYDYAWDFKDWTSWSWKKPKHIYDESWTYNVELTVTDSKWKVVVSIVQIEVIKKEINIEDKWLTVQAEADISEWNVKLNVAFEWLVTGWVWPYIYLWDFWRWNNWSVKNPNNTFDFVWINIVKLTVIDSIWNTWETILSINVLDFDSCSIDSDWDWIMDCDDKLPQIPWDKKNEWVPILEDFCWEWCSCQEWYICTTNNPNICEQEWVCKPEKKVLNKCLEKNSKSFIYWNSVCLSCPCSYSLNFNESIRKCDMIFPAITSPDSKKIYSRWKIYKVK